MNTLQNLFKTVAAFIIMYMILVGGCLLFAPNLVPAVAGTFSVYLIIFKAFFAKDVLRTVLIALGVIVLFGAVSARTENLLIGIIGVIIDVFVLCAGFVK